MVGQDYETYCDLYDIGITKIIDEYKLKYTGIVIHPNAKEKIWEEYKRFNFACKTNYMRNPGHLIDRHKVTACYIYAIIKARVIASEESVKQGDETHMLLNENLAYTFGFSLLRSLILNISHEYESQSPDKENFEKIKQVFDGDVALPQCSHGNYRDNFVSQLYFTWKESSYNILALAESLFLIECFNLVKNGIPENVLLG